MKRLKTVGRRALMGLGVLMLVLIAFVAVRIATHDRPSDEERIERNLEYVFTGEGPAYCDDLITAGYLGQVSEEPAPYADEDCEARSGENKSESIAVAGISIDGDRASARVTPKGGALSGSTLTIDLVHADDYWRVDRLVSLDHLDRAAFRRAWRRSFLAFGSPQSAATCAVARERRLSDAEIEADLLGSGPSRFGPIAVECDRAGVERSTVVALASPGYGYPAAGIRCAERRMRAAGEAELIALGAHAAEYGRLALACDPKAPFDTIEQQFLADGYDRATVDCVLEVFRRHSPQRAFRLGFEDERYEAIVRDCEDA